MSVVKKRVKSIMSLAFAALAIFGVGPRVANNFTSQEQKPVDVFGKEIVPIAHADTPHYGGGGDGVDSDARDNAADVGPDTI